MMKRALFAAVVGGVACFVLDGGWLNKFVPKPDADPAKLIGRSLVLE
jgi:hypothetical protein